MRAGIITVIVMGAAAGLTPSLAWSDVCGSGGCPPPPAHIPARPPTPPPPPKRAIPPTHRPPPAVQGKPATMTAQASGPRMPQVFRTGSGTPPGREALAPAPALAPVVTSPPAPRQPHSQSETNVRPLTGAWVASAADSVPVRRPATAPQPPAGKAPTPKSPVPRTYVAHGHLLSAWPAPPYHCPPEYRHRRFHIGQRFPIILIVDEYILSDFDSLGLEAPPAGLIWVRYGDDALLVNPETGEVVEVVHGVFEETSDADAAAPAYDPAKLGYEPLPAIGAPRS